MKLLNGANDWKVSVDFNTSLQFQVHIIQTEKWPDSKKSVLLLELIDCPLVRKLGGRHMNRRKTNVCRLHGKRLDMPCDSYWGWLSWFSRMLSHFVSIKNKNHWPQFESCLILSSDHSAICIKLDLVKNKVFSMYEMHAESSYLGDYVTSRNGYCKHIMTSMAESKSILKITNCRKNEDEHAM